MPVSAWPLQPVDGNPAEMEEKERVCCKEMEDMGGFCWGCLSFDGTAKMLGRVPHALCCSGLRFLALKGPGGNPEIKHEERGVCQAVKARRIR